MAANIVKPTTPCPSDLKALSNRVHHLGLEEPDDLLSGGLGPVAIEDGGGGRETRLPSAFAVPAIATTPKMKTPLEVRQTHLKVVWRTRDPGRWMPAVDGHDFARYFAENYRTDLSNTAMRHYLRDHILSKKEYHMVKVWYQADTMKIRHQMKRRAARAQLAARRAAGIEEPPRLLDDELVIRVRLVNIKLEEEEGMTDTKMADIPAFDGDKGGEKEEEEADEDMDVSME